MEIFTLVVALIGAIGTVSSWLISLWNNRVSLDFQLYEITYALPTSALFYGSITNKANSSIIISDIILKTDNKEIHLDKTQCVVLTEVRTRTNMPTEEFRTYNSKFPVTLSPYSSESCYFHFRAIPNTPLKLDKQLNFEIYTNRKAKIKFSFELDTIPVQHSIC